MVMHDIKNNKPNKLSRFSQGYINPQACHKMFESMKSKPVIFRSSWERIFVTWCEMSQNVKRWASEPIAIPYTLPDGTKHTYYPDFFVEMTSGKKWIVEIKPRSQSELKNAHSDYDEFQYYKNMCKWQAAMKFAEQNNCEFVVVTEKLINQFKRTLGIR